MSRVATAVSGLETYQSFKELNLFEREGESFEVVARLGSSGVAIIAPHGGNIEPGTTELASAVAGKGHSYYSLLGLLPERESWRLHITSTRFDEPKGIAVIESAETVVAIHACLGEEQFVIIGGLDLDLRVRCYEALRAEGLPATMSGRPALQGLSTQNLCNRGQRGKGLQLEFSRGLMNQLLESRMESGRTLFDRTVEALREVLA